MKRWLLPVAQLMVALAVVAQGLVFSAVLGLPLFLGIMTGRSGPLGLYVWAALGASIAIDVSALTCLASGVVLVIRNPSRPGAWFSIAGAICYWVFVASHLTMISTLGPLRVYITPLDAVELPIGIFAAFVAFSVYSFERRARRSAQ